MKTKNIHYRQGDVLIQRVGSFPKKLQKVSAEGGRLVLAHGSSTGHSHALDAKDATLASCAAEAGALFLEVKVKSAQVTHQEHTAIVLPKGKYRVTRQREFSPEAVRTVMD